MGWTPQPRWSGPALLIAAPLISTFQAPTRGSSFILPTSHWKTTILAPAGVEHAKGIQSILKFIYELGIH